MGLPVPVCIPASSPLWISAPPQVESDSSCSAETGPSAPVAMALQHQPGQSGRRRVSEPLLLKPEQDTLLMEGRQSGSHRETSALRFQPGFCLHIFMWVGVGGRLGFLNSFLQRASCTLWRTPRSQGRVHDKKTSSMIQKGPQLSRTQLQMSPSSLFPRCSASTWVSVIFSCILTALPSPICPGKHSFRRLPTPQSKKRTEG